MRPRCRRLRFALVRSLRRHADGGDPLFLVVEKQTGEPKHVFRRLGVELGPQLLPIAIVDEASLRQSPVLGVNPHQNLMGDIAIGIELDEPRGGGLDRRCVLTRQHARRLFQSGSELGQPEIAPFEKPELARFRRDIEVGEELARHVAQKGLEARDRIRDRLRLQLLEIESDVISAEHDVGGLDVEKGCPQLALADPDPRQKLAEVAKRLGSAVFAFPPKERGQFGSGNPTGWTESEKDACNESFVRERGRLTVAPRQPQFAEGFQSERHAGPLLGLKTLRGSVGAQSTEIRIDRTARE